MSKIVTEFIYPWHEAPEQAEYATTSKYGYIEWWAGKPTLDYEDVWGTDFEVRTIFLSFGGKINYPDWRNSLEKRPI